MYRALVFNLLMQLNYEVVSAYCSRWISLKALLPRIWTNYLSSFVLIGFVIFKCLMRSITLIFGSMGSRLCSTVAMYLSFCAFSFLMRSVSTLMQSSTLLRRTCCSADFGLLASMDRFRDFASIDLGLSKERSRGFGTLVYGLYLFSITVIGCFPADLGLLLPLRALLEFETMVL